MEQQEITAIETTQAEIEEDFFRFADLDLTDEQLAEIKGGPWGCSWCGYTGGNHNETTVEDEEAETEALDDLSVEDYEQVKGGPSGGITKLGNKLLTL